MSVRWDFFVNAFDTHRYLPAAGLEGRENRNLAYVREFAAVVSILQVSLCVSSMHSVSAVALGPASSQIWSKLVHTISHSHTLPFIHMNTELSWLQFGNWLLDLGQDKCSDRLIQGD